MKKIPDVSILFEDDVLLAVNKPSEVSVHFNRQEAEGLQEQLEKKRKQKLVLFHRLDRGTSGVLLFGKKPSINKAMQAQFEKRQIQKTYLLEVEGAWPARLKNIKNFLRYSPQRGSTGGWLNSSQGNPSEAAHTRFEIIRRRGDTTLLRAYPKTGRQHQIRLHAQLAGHPIVGDRRYGSRRPGPMRLHAESLTFRHPISGQKITISADCEWVI